MESKIVDALRLTYPPVVILWTDDKPEGALSFKEGKWGCVMWLLCSASKGRVAAFDRKTFGCIGGGVGLGFGNLYSTWPGGIECFYYFLSTGVKNWEEGMEIAEKIRPFMRKESFDNLVHGEGYVKSPELVEKFVECLPMTDVPAEYVVFKRLADVDAGAESPRVVIFFADPDQLSALVVLANYSREDNENVIMPQGAGCQQIGIIPYKEAKSEKPRAVVGMTDLSARLSTRRQLGENTMTFAVPFEMFTEMEDNVEGSFLERHTWQSILKQKSE